MRPFIERLVIFLEWVALFLMPFAIAESTRGAR